MTTFMLDFPPAWIVCSDGSDPLQNGFGGRGGEDVTGYPGGQHTGADIPGAEGFVTVTYSGCSKSGKCQNLDLKFTSYVA